MSEWPSCLYLLLPHPLPSCLVSCIHFPFGAIWKTHIGVLLQSCAIQKTRELAKKRQEGQSSRPENPTNLILQIGKSESIKIIFFCDFKIY